MPWRREGQPTPVFLPGKFHGQKSLVDCSPWGLKESDVTEHSVGMSCWHEQNHFGLRQRGRFPEAGRCYAYSCGLPPFSDDS